MTVNVLHYAVHEYSREESNLQISDPKSDAYSNSATRAKCWTGDSNSHPFGSALKADVAANYTSPAKEAERFERSRQPFNCPPGFGSGVINHSTTLPSARGSIRTTIVYPMGHTFTECCRQPFGYSCNTPAEIRTQNIWFLRPAPLPLDYRREKIYRDDWGQ